MRSPDSKEIKNTSDALEHSEEFHQQLLTAIIESSSDAIISRNLDGLITSWNAAAEKLYGYDAEEIIGLPVSCLLPFDRKEEEPRIMEHIRRGERVESFDTIRIHKDGTPIDISLSISPIRDKRGNIIGASKIARDIRLQKKLQEQFIQNEERLRIATESASLGVWDWYPISGDIIWDRRTKELFGLPPDAEVDFTVFLSALHPDDLEITKRVFDNLLDPAHDGKYELEFRTIGVTDKKLRWLRAKGRAFQNDIGQTSRFTGTVHDITREKMAELQLRDSEERLRMAIDATHLGTWDYQPLQDKLYWSDECRKIYDIPSDVTVDYNLFLAHIHPQDVEIATSAIANAMDPSGTGTYDVQYRILRYSDKSPRWIRAQGRVYFDARRQPEMFIGTVLDITTEKAREQELIDSIKLFQRLADNLPVMIWTSEPDLKCTYLSAQWYEYTGVSRDQGLGFRWIDFIHPEDRERASSRFMESSNRQEPIQHVLRMKNREGVYRWMMVAARPQFDLKGAYEGFTGVIIDIDERKRMEEAVRENEFVLSLAMETTEMGTWLLNIKTKEAEYTKQYLKILGYNEDNRPTYEDIVAQIYEEDLPLRNQSMRDALISGIMNYELRMIRKDGNLRWIKVKGKVLYDENGEAEKILGTILDITEEKKAASALRESEERFRIIANTAPVMIWMSGNDRFADFFNTCWLNFTGRTLEQEMNEGWQENVHPDDLPNCIKIYEQSYQEQQAFSVEYRLRRADGEYRWILDNAVPRFSHDGNFIGFVSACMDIDDEKRFNEKLQASELMFKTITNVSPVGLWMTDNKGNNTYVNDTWKKWTGLDNSNNNKKGWMDSLLSEDRSPVYTDFLEKMERREKFTAEFRFTRTDGQIRWGLTEGFPFFDDHGNFEGYAGSVTDITERKKTELLKNEFLAVASHELKTPLTSIKAYSQLLSQSYERVQDAFLKNGLIKMENQVNKMTKLVNDFLNLSKLESDKFSLDKERFDLNELVREIASDIQMLAINHTFLLEKKRPVLVNADKEKISQVVTNLLNNAVKYSPDDKTINVTVREDRDWVTVSVVDKGIGIKAGEHEKIFQRFYRSEHTNNISFSGFGIGLYISSEIIKKHEGEIGVISEEGKGADFYFKLPVVH
jgi:PAS domain S-box-containing protein